MKRKFYFLLALFFLFAGICGLTGCSRPEPIIFQSQLTIQIDESGCRTITAQVSKDTLKSLFGNKNTSFQSFIQSFCPEGLNWYYVETGTSYELTFEIPFNSLDEYQHKIGQLTGVSNSVIVTRPQVGVKTGFTFQETTDILSLFSWFRTALENRTNAGNSTLNSLLVNGDNQLFYADRYYEQEDSGLYIYVETLHDAESIDILTELTLNNSWNRTVYIHFPDAMLANAANVKPYLSSLLPKNITESWENSTTWILRFPSCTLDELGVLMNGLFQSMDKDVLNESVITASSMRFVHQYAEPVNVTFFVPNSGSTTVRYYVKNAENGLISIDTGYQTPAISLNDRYDGFSCLYEKQMAQDSFSFSASYQYQPQEIEVDTTVISSQDIRRTVTLKMGKKLPAVHRDLMIASLTSLSQDHGHIMDKEENDSYTIYCKENGTQEAINAGFSAVFGGYSSFFYKKDPDSLFEKTTKVSFSDSFDFSAFLAESDITPITYTLTLPTKDRLEDGSHVLTQTLQKDACSVSGYASRTNALRTWFFVLDAVTGILLLYLFIKGPLSSYLSANARKSSAAQKKANGNKRKKGSGQTNRKTQSSAPKNNTGKTNTGKH